MIYRITAHSKPGIYGNDTDGHPWATFTLVNNTKPCHDCGEMITSGWMRGRLGEAIYVCSKHVTATYEEGTTV